MKHLAWLKAMENFFTLPLSEKCILVEAAIFLWAARIGLWLLPIATFKIFAGKQSQSSRKRREGSTFSVDELSWAIEVMSGYVPGATCLTKALAAKMLLTRFCYSSVLHIGVAKGKDGSLDAHAWLEQQGTTIIGRVDRDYSKILSLGTQEP